MALKLSGKMMVAAHHRRKSSERFVTNEGPRKLVRDFDVFEMQGRRQQPALSFKHVSRQTTGHQTKRITSSKQQISGQQKTKKVGANGKIRKKSCSSQKDDHSNLPKTVQVDDLVMQRPGFSHKFSASLFGALGSDLSLGETSA